MNQPGYQWVRWDTLTHFEACRAPPQNFRTGLFIRLELKTVP